MRERRLGPAQGSETVACSWAHNELWRAASCCCDVLCLRYTNLYRKITTAFIQYLCIDGHYISRQSGVLVCNGAVLRAICSIPDITDTEYLTPEQRNLVLWSIYTYERWPLHTEAFGVQQCTASCHTISWRAMSQIYDKTAYTMSHLGQIDQIDHYLGRL